MGSMGWPLSFELTELIATRLTNWSDVASMQRVCRAMRYVCSRSLVVVACSRGLSAACQSGNADIVNMLLCTDISPDTGGLLVTAAHLGHLDVARVLLMHGAVPDEEALIAAVRSEHYDVMMLLLTWGDNPPHADCRGGQAMFYACYHKNPRIAHTLLSWPRHAPRADCMNSRPFFAACMHADISVVEAFMTRGARASVHDSAALAFAASEARVDVVHLLLTFLRDPAKADSRGGALALMVACKYGHLEVAELLLSHNLRADCSEGVALVAACYKGQVRVAKMLLARKFDAPSPDCRNCEAFIKACEGGHADVAALLLSHLSHLSHRIGSKLRSAIPEVLESVCRQGHVSTLRVLLKASPGADYGNCVPRALLAACRQGHTAIVGMLIIYVPRGCCMVMEEAVDTATRHGHLAVRELLMSF
jgi:ankyrin repeat protein